MKEINFKIGMYVRVSVDFEDETGNPRMFAMGQIESINGFGNYVIEFNKNFKNIESKIIYTHIPDSETYVKKDICRCKILNGSNVLFDLFESGKILSFSREDENGYYYYYIEGTNGKVKEICESEILADFNRCKYEVSKQIENYELHNPFWYVKRQISSKSLNIIKNAPKGFDTLISSRTYLYSHQVDTVLRALNENKEIRLMLADEVGLGKTIEAAVVLKGLLKENKKLKALIIVPEALAKQWKNELDIKFWIKSEIWNGISDKSNQITILGLESLTKFPELNIESFDLCIIDEAHRIIGMDSEYKRLLKICESIKNVLVLTATPIQDRKEEYLKLLALLNPKKYKEMNNDSFMKIYKKSNEIKSIVYSIIKDLEDLDEDLMEDILDALEEMNEILEDKNLNKLFNDLSDDIEIFEEQVKEILSYVTINYQIEKNIIRHRREEISNILPKRTINEIEYEMVGSEEDFFERDSYEYLIDYINELKVNNIENPYLGEVTIILLNAMFSSANALEWVLNKRLNHILKFKKGIIFKENLSLLNTPKKEELRKSKIITTFDSWDNEKNILEKLIYLVSQWKIASEKELRNIEVLMEDPDKIKGRLGKLVDYINEELVEEKLVLFTSWKPTLETFYNVLEKVFGKEAIAKFSVGLSDEELEESIYRFQSDNNCRFILCDELGSEGRNFQNADKIINIDIPFSPIILEQRIGRLDRIGRKINSDVESIVIFSNNSLEEDLFKLWRDGLNIFSESLSGMEIALDDINKSILGALKKDISYGLKDSIEDIKKSLEYIKGQVKKERHYDMARQISKSEKQNFEKMIKTFDSANGHLLERTMLEWARAVGLSCEYSNYSEDRIVYFSDRGISAKSMINTAFDIPDTKVALSRSKDENKIIGTFNRTKAVENENLVFFAPGENIFDSIMNNVQEGYRGQSVAFEIEGCGFEWEGFLFTWNSNFGITELIDADIDIRNKTLTQGYIQLEQIKNLIEISDSGISEKEISKFLEDNLYELVLRKKAKHLGKRDISGILRFKKIKLQQQWVSEYREALKRSKEKRNYEYKKHLDLARFKKDFSNKIIGLKFSESFFNLRNKEEIEREIEYLKKIYKHLIEGIKKPNFELDSVAYIKLKR